MAQDAVPRPHDSFSATPLNIRRSFFDDPTNPSTMTSTDSSSPNSTITAAFSHPYRLQSHTHIVTSSTFSRLRYKLSQCLNGIIKRPGSLCSYVHRVILDTLLSLKAIFDLHPTHPLLRYIHIHLTALSVLPQKVLSLRVPGYICIPGNESVDEAAKQVTINSKCNQQARISLPSSATASLTGGQFTGESSCL